MTNSNLCSGCGAPLQAERASCAYCGQRALVTTDPDNPDLTPAQRRAQASALRAFHQAHAGVWWIVTLVGLGIIASGAIFTARAFGPWPALLFGAFGVAWILIARAGRAVVRAQRAASPDDDDPDGAD